MHQVRAFGALILAGAAGMAGLMTSPARASDLEGGSADLTVVAFLDGRPLPLKLVASYYCDDFSFPVIECSTSAATTDARASLSLLSGITYVTMYDQTNYSGTYMNVSQDYSTLLTIGWSDRVSSFRARNSESGEFSTDWFFGGSTWPFCCNSQVSSLGAYDNTFSSVRRT